MAPAFVGLLVAQCGLCDWLAGVDKRVASDESSTHSGSMSKRDITVTGN
jgi:hypothetical protein